jgi:phosphatidylglycerol:prolipoprotein diacylglycerol transferase
VNVDWGYQLIMATALTAGWLVSRATASGLALPPAQRLGVLLGAFCGAMIGAKLPYLFGDLDAFVSGAAWFQNGKTILCGLVGGYAGVELTKWSLGITVKTGDSFAVPVPVSVAIGRLGCFHAGCCYGTPSDSSWSVVFPAVDRLPRHPTQLYEAAFHLCMAAVLLVLWRQGRCRGQLIKLYIMLYAVYRLLSETIRPEPRLGWGLTAYQWGSLAILVLFAGIWYRDRKPSRRAAARLAAQDA